MNEFYFAFGPVPSRRLGKSLGVNNIPPKYCSYACVYCQLGKTLRLTEERREFYDPETIFGAVEKKLNAIEKANGKVDFITLVPDGEPTLDLRLEELARKLKTLDVPLAVISNSSLIHLEEVRNALSCFDWVSLKVDSVKEETWKKIDRPYGRIGLKRILNGLKRFAESYERGTLAIETMLVRGINDNYDELTATADFIETLNPEIVYISVPTRPPAEDFVLPPEKERISEAYEIFSEKIKNAKLNATYDEGAFGSGGNFVEEFLSIISVHPMRKEAVIALLEKKGEKFSVVEDLVKKGIVIEKKYNGEIHYLRNLKKEETWKK